MLGFSPASPRHVYLFISVQLYFSVVARRREDKMLIQSAAFFGGWGGEAS